jgi:hypothetical protein
MADRLAEKDAMLGMCAEALEPFSDAAQSGYTELDWHKPILPPDLTVGDLFYAKEVLASLPTTTQDVIAKVRNDELMDAYEYIGRLMPRGMHISDGACCVCFPEEDHGSAGDNWLCTYHKAICALKTEEK